jgi:hypothetical protein
MLTFMFWNLKQARRNILNNLVRTHKVDVLMLTECPMLPATVLEALNQRTSDFYYVPTDCAKIAVYTRFSDQYLLPVRSHADFTIARLALPTRQEILVCIVHFPSKSRYSPADQQGYASRFSDIVADAEEEVGHTRTLLVGDLNMNPYEDGVVTATGLHAVMTREIAHRRPRRVKFESNAHFYNPMWRHFGERAEGHAGTYYYSAPKTRADFWNIYDQVLLRPALLSHFRDEELHILHQDATAKVSFLTDRGLPDSASVSDHLPIVFVLRI